MKFIPLAFLLLAIWLVIPGCYEMKQDEKGRTVKMNRITGEVSVIDGDKIVKLKDEKGFKAEQEAIKKLGEPKLWAKQPLPIIAGANASLITKWSDGNIFFQFFVDKSLRVKGKYSGTFTVELDDDAGFLIEKITISVFQMTGNLGADEKLIQSMEYKSKSAMSEGTYKTIRNWNVTWAGFD